MNQISPMAFISTAIMVAILIAALVTLVIRRAIARKKKAAEKPPASPEQKPKSYTYEEFSRDFMNENVSIDDILKRYGGADVPPAPKKDEPKKESEQPEKPERDLAAERQAWFARASEKQQKLKIVPPPIQQVVIALKGITVPCPSCKADWRQANYHQPRRQDRCEKCNGMGVIVIVGGK